MHLTTSAIATIRYIEYKKYALEITAISSRHRLVKFDYNYEGVNSF